MHRYKHTILLCACLLVLLGTRLLPLLKAPLGTFGYDFGFYLYTIKHIHYLTLYDLSSGITGGYNNPLFYILRLLPFSLESSLVASYILLVLGSGVALYTFVKKYSQTASLWAILLLAFSIPQNEMYLMFLSKTVLGLMLLLLAYQYLIEKRYALLTVISIALIITHRTTTILYGITLILYALFISLQKRKYKLFILESIALITASAIIFPYVHRPIHDFLFYPNTSVHEGIFLNIADFLKASWIYILLAIPGIYMYHKDKEHPILPIFLSLSAGWVLLQLPFYKRILIYVDIALIIYAAYFLSKNKLPVLYKKIGSIVIIGLLAFQVGAYYVYTQPLITTTKIQEIKAITAANSGAFIVATDASDAPWLLGYSNGVRLAAPGLFEDRHTYAEWEKFWDKKPNQAFFNRYPRPLLIYTNTGSVINTISDCTERISGHFYKYVCN